MRPLMLVLSALLVTLIGDRGLLLAADAPAAAPGQAAPPAATDAKSAEPQVSGRLQEFDDVVAPLQPVATRTPEQAQQLEAVTWFLTGRVRELRDDTAGAIEAYRKSIELAPNEANVLQALVPLLFRGGQIEEGLKLARRFADLQPDNVQLHYLIGAQLAEEGNLLDAIRYMSTAVQSPKIDRKSLDYVQLNRDLALLYAATKQTELAAEAFDLVFTALTSPGEYDIDLATRTRLISDDRTGFAAMGKVFLEAKRTDKALQAFELAAKAALINAGELTYRRAQIFLAKGEHQAALDELQKYFDAERQTRGQDPYELLAEILTAMGRGDELIPRLEALVEKDKRNAPLRLFLGNRLVDVGELERAEKLFTDSASRSRDPQALLGLARVYRRQARADDLLSALGRMLAKGGLDRLEDIEKPLEVEFEAIVTDERLLNGLFDAGRAQAKTEPSSLEFEEAFMLAKLATQAKQIDAAEEFYRLSLNNAGDRKSLVYPALADMLADAGRYAEAASVYKEAMEVRGLDDKRLEMMYLMAHALEMSGATDDALATVEEVKQLIGPDLPRPFLLQRAWIFTHSQQYDKAVEVYEALMRETPPGSQEFRRCQYGLSNVYVQQGNIRRGEEILEQVYAEAPDDPSVNNDLGYLYADQGKKLEQAEQMIRKAVAAEPENAAYLDSLGWVLFKLGRFEEALQPLQKSVELAEGQYDATLLEHLGDCLHRLNRNDEARTAWKNSLTAAERETRPDTKLVGRLKEKLGEGTAVPADEQPATNATAAEPTPDDRAASEAKPANESKPGDGR